MNKKTRLQTYCPIIGESDELTESSPVLPTLLQVLKHYEFLHTEYMKTSDKEPSKSVFSSQIAKTVKKIWEKASIPTVDERFIQQMVEKAHTKFRGLRKVIKLRPESEAHRKQVADFVAVAIQLFDVAKCKCEDMSQCKCDKSNRVPEQECIFWNGDPQTDIFDFPCHSQAVERCVQVVSGVSQNVCGQESRDGYCRTTFLDRKITPVFNTKRDFKTE